MDDDFIEVIAEMERTGLIERDGEMLRLTPKGKREARKLIETNPAAAAYFQSLGGK